ncbi:micronuclear linker histone polyprotein-like [Montipora capricornis]|uniref:micronuclear linker histone polyprotein-like n=1 Tax=Montipora capricornis TaxID=246305 RepID=UPI0035F135CE
MRPRHSYFPHVFVVFVVKAFCQPAKGNLNTDLSLEKIIEEAEKESKQIANEINQWLLRESGSFLKEDEQMHFRSRRSVDVDFGESRTDTKLLSEASQHIERRATTDNDKKVKKYPKKKKGVSVIKSRTTKIKKSRKLKKKRKDKTMKKKNSRRAKQRIHVQAKRGNKAKNVQKGTDELSKANLVKELIGADLDAKKDLGVPEKAYRQLIEIIATSAEPIVENKKSDIARPLPKALSYHNKLTNRHKRVLAFLAKMAPDVLRKYFHRKGLDKYWKIMENLRKRTISKRGKKRSHKNAKSLKAKVIFSPKKTKPYSVSKHQTKAIFKKAESRGSRYSRRSKFPKNPTKMKKARTIKLETKKVRKVNPRVREGQQMNKTGYHKKKGKLKDRQVQKRKLIPRVHENKNAIKSKIIVHEEENHNKKASRKTLKRPNILTSREKYPLVTQKSAKKPRFPEVNDTRKQGHGEKGRLVAVAFKKELSLKNTTKQIISTSSSPKGNTSLTKIPEGSLKPAQGARSIQNRFSSTETGNTKEEEQTENQQQSKGMAVSSISNATRTTRARTSNWKVISDEKQKDVDVNHVMETTHSQQPSTRQNQKVNKTSLATQNNPGADTIEFLAAKVKKTNTLKLKVAQALLAHCETQNRLRQVFNDVNSSLKKAEALAKAIGTKFGIKPSDINKITSQHTEDAVEQFLNHLF